MAKEFRECSYSLNIHNHCMFCIFLFLLLRDFLQQSGSQFYVTRPPISPFLDFSSAQALVSFSTVGTGVYFFFPFFFFLFFSSSFLLNIIFQMCFLLFQHQCRSLLLQPLRALVMLASSHPIATILRSYQSGVMAALLFPRTPRQCGLPSPSIRMITLTLTLEEFFYFFHILSTDN